MRREDKIAERWIRSRSGKTVPNWVDITVVGAGPFGLSLAAHLRKVGVEHRIVGKPMEST